MRSHSLIFAVCLLVAASSSAREPEDTLLLRFPDVHRDSVVFVYAGDLWVAPVEGGTAQRLTSHPGLELFPKFSPDGRWIAFSAEYGGTRQVEVISVDGGAPRQLTFYDDVGPMPPRGGFDNQVMGWTPDGGEVLFRANRLPWGVRMGRPYLVPFAGGTEHPMVIPEGGGGTFSPDGKRFAYTPIAREFRTWKRYRGGRAQDVWIYDLEANASERITDFEGTDNQPAWVGDTIYFTSDRDGKLNLYAYDTATRETREVTHHRDFDVLWPSGGPESVVYENGGAIWRFDPATGESHRLPIRIYGDLPYTVPYWQKVAGQVESFGLSPQGKRAVVAARGEILTLPAEHGEVRNLTRTPGVREMAPTFSPDGQWIAYLSDRTGEYEIYLRRHDGTGEERQVTRNGEVWRFPPLWSPDGRKLVFGDRKQRLRIVEVEGGKVTEVDHSDYEDITTYTWSPDSRWVAYVKSGPTRMSSVWVYSTETGTAARLTGDQTPDGEPVFDPKGRYLYFLSNRDYDLTFSAYEFDYVYTDATRIYVGLLDPDAPPLFLPKSDEAGSPQAAKPNGGDGAVGDGGEEAPRVTVVTDGFGARVRALPLAAGRYRALAATADGVTVLRGSDPRADLVSFDLEKEKEEVLAEGVTDYALGAGGGQLIYRRGDGLTIVPLGKAVRAEGTHELAVDRLEVEVVPRKEWHEEFVDGWRILRDWFYDPRMHGLDWQAIRARYEPLVDHVAHRFDLDYLFGEMGGELQSSHVYVEAGDYHPHAERVEGGLLGADIVPDPSGYYRIAEIFPGESWHPDFRSPLAEPGVQVEVGDLILSVDGRTTRGVDNFYRLLQNRADRIVALEVNDRPSEEGARKVLARPIARETNLRYLRWVRSRQAMVDRLSGGRIGYLHLPNTSFEGNRELVKHFLPQTGKDALIIDARYNGGGFIPDRMIELVGRTTLNYWAQRGIEPQPTPGFAHDGPKVCLINGYSSSGGDAFPYYFRELGLGKLIGTRTWGGLIGISSNPSLLDGGAIEVPTFRFLDNEGHWAVENAGVSPDIEVVDRPEEVAAGHDPILEKAVEVLLDELQRNPPRRIQVPPRPTDFSFPEGGSQPEGSG